MATLYNKTALNKIKKAELVQLFLDQQAEKNQLILDAEEHEKLKSHIIYMGHTKMKADLKKLKEENKELKILVQQYQGAVCDFGLVTPEEIKETMDEYYDKIERLEEITGEVYDLRDENKKLKGKNEDLNRRFNDVNHVPFNSNYTDKAIDEFLSSIPKRFLKEDD